MIKSGVDFVEFMNLNIDAEDVPKIDARSSSFSSSISSRSSHVQRDDTDGNNIDLQMEETSKGKVKGSVVLRYILAGTHWFILILLAIAFLFVEICASGSDYWLSIW